MRFNSTKYSENKNITAILWLLFACFVAVLTDAISKSIVNEIGLLQVTCIKHIFSFIIMVLLLFFKQKKLQYKPNIFQETSRGIVLLSGSLLWLQGLKYSNMTCAGIISMAQPLFIIIFSKIFLKEKLSLVKFIIMFIGLALLISIIMLSEKTTFSIGAIFLIIGVICWALLDVITKNIVAKNRDTLTNTFYTALFAALFSLILLFFTKVNNINLHQLAILFIIGLLYNLMIACFIKAFHSAPLGILAPYKYSEMLFAFILDFVFFANLPNKMVQYYAICIIPGSIAIIVIDIIKSKKTKNSSIISH